MWSRRLAIAALALAVGAAHAGAQGKGHRHNKANPAASPSPDAEASPGDTTASPERGAPAPIQNAIPTPAPSASPGGTEAPAPSGECAGGATCVSSGQFERFGDGHSQFRGFVDLVFGDTRIQTDKLDLFEMPRADGGTARRLVAEGNVLFLRGEERLSGEKLDMELDTSRGTFENAF